MDILLRLKIAGKVATIIEDNNTIEVEIHGAKSKKEKDAIKQYLEDEGILEEILTGNTKFATPLPSEDIDNT